MKDVLKYIASVPVQNSETEHMNISLGFEESGRIGIYFGDTMELGQDSNYINKESFPNSGLLLSGKYTMWISMFSRHLISTFEDTDN